MTWTLLLILVPLFFLTCCCASCGSFCLDHGQLFSSCAYEAADQYTVGPIGSLSSVDAECCGLPTQIGHTSGCSWTITENGCDWELFIDGINTEFRQTIDASHTLIYTPSSGSSYNALCPEIFDLDELASTIPEGCSYYRRVCLTPHNNCCDADANRTEPMPTTLYARLTYCFAETANNTIDFQLTWNKPTGTWNGTAVGVGNGDLSVSLECVCLGFSTGCGGAGTECYNLTITHDGCGAAGGETITFDSCACQPFDLIFTINEMANLCCDVSVLAGWILEISEEPFV